MGAIRLANRCRAILHLLPLALGVVACSSGQSTSSGLRPGESASCTVALSGALSGTFDCQPAETTFDSSDQEFFDFNTVSSADAGNALGVSVIIFFEGGPVAASYTQLSPPGDFGGASITGAEGTWSTLPAGGSYQLTFTSFSNPVTYPSGTLYEADGTLDATLVPGATGAGNPATGTVMLHATF